jgi:hypothetical protein
MRHGKAPAPRACARAGALVPAWAAARGLGRTIFRARDFVDAVFSYYYNYNITTTTNYKGTKTQRTHKEICGGLHLCDPCGLRKAAPSSSSRSLLVGRVVRAWLRRSSGRASLRAAVFPGVESIHTF